MLSDLDRTIIARACGDIGDGLYPFRDLAAEVGIPEEELLTRLRGYAACGQLRRFGAILFHQAAGFTANGMSVWNVPDADVQRVAAIMAACDEVSHCYERPRLPDWPYNLFAMIHGRSEADCRQVVARLAAATGLDAHDILFSVREFKKTSMVYERA